MGFFSCVQYASNIQNNSWYGQAEAWADVCRGPRRWLVEQLWGKVQKYEFKQSKGNYKSQPIKSDQIQTAQKVLRIVIGTVLSIPGEICALPLMAFAFANEEIRLKHKLVSPYKLSQKEQHKLATLIEERQRLAQERQGCEPVTCLLFSICCLLCCLVCGDKHV